MVRKGQKWISGLFLQLKKLGVMPPEQPLPPKCYRIYQIMWANNGDTISKQYAGTAALKVTFWSFGHMVTYSQCFSKCNTSDAKCLVSGVFNSLFIFREILPGQGRGN